MERTRQGEFCWIDLSAGDLEAQTAFYEQLFGWEHTDTPIDAGSIYRQFTLYGQVVAGAAPMSDEMRAGGMSSTWSAYVLADDVERIQQKAAGLGAKISMPAMDVMDQGRMLAIVEPGGATTFFWQPGAHRGSRVFMRPGSLMWCDLDTPEPEKAARFFRELLDWRVSKDPEAPGSYWQISVGDDMEAGIMRRPEWMPAAAPPRWLIYLGIADVEAAVKLAEKLGGRAEMEPIVVPEMISFCVLSDPAGATFAIMQPLSELPEEGSRPEG